MDKAPAAVETPPEAAPPVDTPSNPPSDGPAAAPAPSEPPAQTLETNDHAADLHDEAHDGKSFQFEQTNKVVHPYCYYLYILLVCIDNNNRYSFLTSFSLSENQQPDTRQDLTGLFSEKPHSGEVTVGE